VSITDKEDLMEVLAANFAANVHDNRAASFAHLGDHPHAIVLERSQRRTVAGCDVKQGF
jgi:hypothetical protein